MLRGIESDNLAQMSKEHLKYSVTEYYKAQRKRGSQSNQNKKWKWVQINIKKDRTPLNKKGWDWKRQE